MTLGLFLWAIFLILIGPGPSFFIFFLVLMVIGLYLEHKYNKKFWSRYDPPKRDKEEEPDR